MMAAIHTLNGVLTPPIRVGMVLGSIATRSGGVSEAVRFLSLALNRLPTVAVEIFSIEDPRSEAHVFDTLPVHLVRIRGPASFGYAPDLVATLLSRNMDLLHVHGLWMYLSVAARKWARVTGRPYIVSPHGMLDPWALSNNGLKKWLARLLYEDAHLREATYLHALCAQEMDAITAAGIHTPVIVLPNGVEASAAPATPPPWRASLPPDARILLFLGRVTPKKRVLELVQAFCLTGKAAKNWHLVVVGPADAQYRTELDAAVSSVPSCDNVHLVGPAYGEERAAAYAAAHAFILPSLSEGLPMAALEAFAFGLPALLTPQCNLPESLDAGAAFAIGTEPGAIAEGLLRLFSMAEDERMLMGQRARRLAAEKFNWDTIATEMAELYRRLVRNNSGAGPAERRRTA